MADVTLVNDVHDRGVAIFTSKTPEQRADEKQQKEYERWLRSPVGQARTSRERGDLVFQVSFELATQTALVAPMVGVATPSRESDPSQTLNEICAEGWELITGTVVFVATGQESRDKFMSSGQQVAVSGKTIGYYLFRRVG